MIARPVASSRLPVGSSAISERGARAERAGQRDALLLAARKLRGIVREALAEARPRRVRRARALASLAPGQFQRRRDVLERGHGRDEMERLEHDADALPAKPRERVFVQRAELTPSISTSPLSGRSSPAIVISSVDLPEPDGPTRPTASPADCQADVAQDMHARRAAAETQVDIAHFDRGKAIGWSSHKSQVALIWAFAPSSRRWPSPRPGVGLARRGAHASSSWLSATA